MIRKCLLPLFCCLSFLSLQAQDNLWDKTSWSIGIISHSVGLPFKKPLNLGVVIGGEYTYKDNVKNSWHQRLEVGWFHHKELSTAFWLKTDIVKRFTAANGLFVDVQFGLGYIYDIPVYETFTIEDGQINNSKLHGKGGLLTDLGIGGGYTIKIKDKYTLTPFVKYETMFQFPYSDFVPVFPHALFHVGSRMKI